jgi:hypothetical protein
MYVQKIPALRTATGLIFLLGAALLASGCALLAAPAVSEVGSVGAAAGSTGSGISGFLGVESTEQVNNSWIKNNDAQALYYRQQTLSAARHESQEMKQRAASVGILKSMATLDEDPQIADLATWVQAGGDPKFALSYALAQDKRDGARSQAVVMLENMSESDDDPSLYEIARWVRAGGDEKFALNYALNKNKKEPSPARARARSRRSFSSFSQGVEH